MEQSSSIRLFRDPKSVEEAPEHPSSSHYSDEARGGLIDRNALKTKEDRKTIIRTLSNHFLFASLTDEDKEKIAENMQLLVMDTGMTVFKQGRPSKSFYVVRTGQLEVLVNERKVNTIKVGEVFGELALLHYKKPRSVTVKCIELTTLWFIDLNTICDSLGLSRGSDIFRRRESP